MITGELAIQRVGANARQLGHDGRRRAWLGARGHQPAQGIHRRSEVSDRRPCRSDHDRHLSSRRLRLVAARELGR